LFRINTYGRFLSVDFKWVRGMVRKTENEKRINTENTKGITEDTERKKEDDCR